MKLEGFQTIMLGLENNDIAIIQQGNKKLDEGSAELDRWRTELNELYKKHGVAQLKEK